MNVSDSKPMKERPKGGSAMAFLGFTGAFLGTAALAWLGLSALMPDVDEQVEKLPTADEIAAQRKAEELAKIAEKERLAEQKRIAEELRKQAEEEKRKLEKERLAKQAEQERQRELARKNKLQDLNALFNKAVTGGDWKKARNHVNEMLDHGIDQEKAAGFYDLLDEKEEEEKQTVLAINKLLEKVRKLDNGVRSDTALDLLDQAAQLMPKHPDVLELKKKMSAYPFEIHVPKDVASMDEALPKLRAGDTLLIGEGRFYCSIALDKKINIKGAGVGKTILECDTTVGTALYFKKGSGGSTVSEVSIGGMVDENDAAERFALVLIEDDVSVSKVDVSGSTGHGIAILSGVLSLSESTVHANYWDGINLKGKGAKAELKKCLVKGNYEHGVDVWQGAQVSLLECEIVENSGTGVVLMGEGSSGHLTQVKVNTNRQAGVLHTNGAFGKYERVIVEKNLLSGMVIQGAKTRAELSIVVSNRNDEAGFVIDPASSVEGFHSATTEKNRKGGVVRKALIPVAQPAP